ncbi:hypothetical protein DB346_03390 [Verrucomicrobia bacterium LW23]|nr:hypothetical protein DB346_03390 [Verrucomicrobia bacterium LW23]
MDTATLLNLLSGNPAADARRGDGNGVGGGRVPVGHGMVLGLVERSSFLTPMLRVEIVQVPRDQQELIAGLVDEVLSYGLTGNIVPDFDPQTGLLSAMCEVPREASPALFEESITALLAFAERWRDTVTSLDEVRRRAADRQAQDGDDLVWG